MKPLLNEHECAALLGCSHRALQKSRVTGTGVTVPFVKVGGLVRYELDEIAAYIARQRRTTTSDTGAGA